MVQGCQKPAPGKKKSYLKGKFLSCFTSKGRDSQGFPGFRWIPLDSIGFLWIPLDSLPCLSFVGPVERAPKRKQTTSKVSLELLSKEELGFPTIVEFPRIPWDSVGFHEIPVDFCGIPLAG